MGLLVIDEVTLRPIAGALIGVASNTVLKLAIAVTIGRGVFRWYVAAGLAAVAAALVAALRATHGLWDMFGQPP